MDVTGITAYEPPAPMPSVSTPHVQTQTQNKAVGVPQYDFVADMERTVAAHTSAKEKERVSTYDKETMDKIVEQINKSITSYNRAMEISVHEKTKRIMVKVMDTEENRVIRELPPEKVLDAFAATLELAGILLDKKS